MSSTAQLTSQIVDATAYSLSTATEKLQNPKKKFQRGGSPTRKKYPGSKLNH